MIGYKVSLYPKILCSADIVLDSIGEFCSGLPWIMDNGYIIREKNHQTLNMWAFWAWQLAAQTKSIYVEKNVAQSIKCTVVHVTMRVVTLSI